MPDRPLADTRALAYLTRPQRPPVTLMLGRLVGALLAAPLQVHNAAVDPLDPEVASALRSLIDDYRSRCLWFLAPDYFPASEPEIVRVLEAIERHGDRAAFQRSSEIRQWLSQSTNAASAGS